MRVVWNHDLQHPQFAAQCQTCGWTTHLVGSRAAAEDLCDKACQGECAKKDAALFATLHR